MVKKTFIFDLDDTIIANHKDYSYPQVEFVKWILDNTPYNGPDAQYILNRQVEIDCESAELNGFGADRFPTSFRLATHEIFKGLGMVPTPEQLREVYEIGQRAFDKERYISQGLLPGVEKNLDNLDSRGDELILLTKGDEKVQQDKIAANELEKWFSEIKIVLSKDVGTVIEMIGERDKQYVCHVGNSIRSDMRPALEAEIKAAYVPCETWKYERQHNGLSDLPNRHNLHILGGIEEILDRYEVIFRNTRLIILP